jgi:hyperosmotically inducible periplasmic protein
MKAQIDRAPLTVAITMSLPLMLSACAKTVSDTIDDITITARVKTALLNDPQIGATKIDVVTTAGVVTISGSVRSRDEEARAIELARKTPGVKDVKSALQIAPVSSSAHPRIVNVFSIVTRAGTG